MAKQKTFDLRPLRTAAAVIAGPVALSLLERPRRPAATGDEGTADGERRFGEPRETEVLIAVHRRRAQEPDRGRHATSVGSLFATFARLAVPPLCRGVPAASPITTRPMAHSAPGSV